MSSYAGMERSSLEQLLSAPYIGEPAKDRIRAELEARSVSCKIDRVSRKIGRDAEDELEKVVEGDVIAELAKVGFDVVKLSQPQKPKGMTEGTPDLYARHPGRKLRVWIEVKRKDGRVRPKQKLWHKVERDAGGEVWLVWSLRDLHDELRGKGFAV